MEKIIAIKRNYSILVVFIIHLLIFELIKIGLTNSFESIEEKIYLFIKTHENVSFEQTSLFYDQQRNLERSFAIIYIISSLIISSLIIHYYRKNSVGKKLIICLGLYVCYPFLVSSGHDIEIHFSEGHSSLKYYFYLLHLFPYLFLIYKETYIGKTVDITQEVKLKEDIKHQDVLTDLNNLFKMGLITEQEYSIKKEQKIKEKIRDEIIQTEEYKLLLKSTKKGLLSDAEFKIKLEILINENYKLKKLDNLE